MVVSEICAGWCSGAHVEIDLSFYMQFLYDRHRVEEESVDILCASQTDQCYSLSNKACKVDFL